MDNSTTELIKGLAELLKPFIKDEPLPIETYLDESFTFGLTPAEQFAKHNDALKVFQRAMFETRWDIEKSMLMIEQLTAMEERAIIELGLGEDADVEQYIKENAGSDEVKAIIKIRARIESNKASLAEKQDVHMQQEGFITTITTRLNSKRTDLLSIQFGNTAMVRGTQPLPTFADQPAA